MLWYRISLAKVNRLYQGKKNKPYSGLFILTRTSRNQKDISPQSMQRTQSCQLVGFIEFVELMEILNSMNSGTMSCSIRFEIFACFATAKGLLRA